MNTIGNRIKEIRTDFNFTQDKFGKKIGVKKSALSLIEKNERSLTDSVLRNILNEFCVKESWLKDGIGEKYNEELRKQKDFMENELNFMSAALMDRQLALLEKVQSFDEDERVEIITALEEMYSILSIPELERNDYFTYYETVAGMLLEMNRYIGVINEVKLTKDKVYDYIKSVQADLIKITKIFIPELQDNDQIDHNLEAEVSKSSAFSYEEKELIDVYRDLDTDDREEILAMINLKRSRKTNSKKKQTSLISAHDEEAAAAQLKIG